MVKLLWMGLFIRWDKVDKDGGPLQQGQAAWTWGSVTWHTDSITPTVQHLTNVRDWHHIVQHQAGLSVPVKVQVFMCCLEFKKCDLKVNQSNWIPLWGLHKHLLSSTLYNQDNNQSVMWDLGSLLKTPRHCLVYSANSENPALLYLVLLDEHGDHLQLY